MPEHLCFCSASTLLALAPRSGGIAGLGQLFHLPTSADRVSALQNYGRASL
jgi:hypothetical protein